MKNNRDGYRCFGHVRRKPGIKPLIPTSKIVSGFSVGNVMGTLKYENICRETRYPINTRIELEMWDGTKLFVTTSNISATGLQFSCNNWAAKKIEPKGIHLHSLDHIDLKMRFEKHDLVAHAQVVFARRVSQDEFKIGVSFTELDENSQENLTALLQKTTIHA